MHQRRGARALATFTAVVLLGACAQGSGADTPTADFSSSGSMSGELEVMGFGTSDEIASTRVDLAKKALGSDVTVKLDEGELDIQQFLSAVASDDPPALIYADRAQIGSFASRGAILPLDDCIDAAGIDTSQFRESALDQVTFGDHVYGIPEFNVVQIIQANQDLLDQAGLTLADVNGSDWDATTKAAQELVRHDGGKLSVIGFDSKLPEFLPLWAHANGVDLISSDGRTAQLNDPRVVQALTWAVGIYDEQGGFSDVKAFRDSADFFGSGNQFATGTLGAMPMEQWYVNVLNDVSPDAPMAFDTVRDRNGDPIAYASGSAWAVPAGSPDPAAACTFAATMTATTSWVAAAKARLATRSGGGIFTGLLTGNRVADEQIRAMVKTSRTGVWGQGIKATYDANDHTFSLPANPAGEEFTTAWEDAVNRVLNGQQSAQEALDQAQQEAQDALDTAWSSWDG